MESNGKPKVGDVYYTSWGYNMTINQFLKVVEVSKTGKTVVCVMVGAKTVEGYAYGPGGSQVVVDPDTVLNNEKFRMHVRKGWNDEPTLRGSYPYCAGHNNKRKGTFWKDSGSAHYENHMD